MAWKPKGPIRRIAEKPAVGLVMGVLWIAIGIAGYVNDAGRWRLRLVVGVLWLALGAVMWLRRRRQEAAASLAGSSLPVEPDPAAT